MKMLAVVFLVLTGFSHTIQAQDSPFYKSESQVVIKMISQQVTNYKNCSRLVSVSKTEECQAFQQKFKGLLIAQLAALDEWQKAVAEKDTPKSWDGKVRYNQAVVEVREISRDSWNKNFFPEAIWTPPAKPFATESYAKLREDAQYKIDNLCAALPGDRPAACTQAFEELKAAISDVSACVERKESARASADRPAFMDAFVDESRAIVKLTVTQSRVFQSY